MKTINLKNYDGSVSSYATNKINLTDDSNNQVPFIDTSDANAAENNLTYGKVGYVNGQRLVGTRRDEVDVNGIIADYQVRSGENISAGDFVEFFQECLSRPNSCTNAPSAVKLDENRVFIAHQYGNMKYLYGTIVTINGTEMTPVTTQLSTVVQSCILAPSAILLEPNKVFIAHAYGSSYYLYGTIVTINGTEMTPITTQLSIISNSCILAPSAILLGTNKIFIAHSYSSNYHLYGTIVTINDTTMTPITTQLSIVSRACYHAPSAILLGPNKVFIAHSYTSSNYYLYGTIVTINDTTMTQITTQLSTVGNLCRLAPSAILLEDNKIFIAHSYSTGYYLYGTIVTINGTEMVTTTTQLSTVSRSCYYAPSAILLEANKVFIAHSYDGSSKYLYGTIVTINDTTMTQITTQLSIISNSCILAPSAILLETNKIFIAHSYSTGYYLCGTIATVEGNLPSPFATPLKTYAYPYETNISGIAYSSSDDSSTVQVKIPQ